MQVFNRILFFIGIALLVFIVIYFFAFSNSYQKSFQAKIYYNLNRLDDAYRLSHEAYIADPYNKMEFTIQTQSKISLKLEKYIQDGTRYLVQIEKLSEGKSVKHSSLIKIKLICEIMIDGYKMLSTSTLTNKNLIQETKTMYDKFKKLYNELQ